MALIYAVEDGTGRRFLARIECDECGASIKPNPQIAESGWARCGIWRGVGGDHDKWDYCPDHAGPYMRGNDAALDARKEGADR